MKDRMHTARDLCLGPRDQRSRCAPTKMAAGEYIGGAAVERNSRAIPVHVNTRCYTIGNSYETQTKIMAPCATNKVRGDQDKEVLEMRNVLLKVSRYTLLDLQLSYIYNKAGSAMAMESLEAGPSEVLEHISINADLINVPTMGTDLNIAYTAAQLNIAPAQPYESGTFLNTPGLGILSCSK